MDEAIANCGAVVIATIGKCIIGLAMLAFVVTCTGAMFSDRWQCMEAKKDVRKLSACAANPSCQLEYDELEWLHREQRVVANRCKVEDQE